MRILQSLEVGDALDLLAVPAAHLRPGIAGGQAVDAVLRVEFIEQRDAAASYIQAFCWRLLSPNGTVVPKAKAGSLSM